MNILKRSAWSALTVIMLLLIGAPTYANPAARHHLPEPPQETRRPLPPRQYVPSHDYDTKHITLNLHFDWEKEQAIGTATIILSPLVKDLRAVVLDAANMTINSVILSAEKSSDLKFVSDNEKQKLTINLDRPYQPNDEITLLIDYHTNGSLPRDLGLGGGLRFNKPSADDPKRPKQIYTQGESEYNHYWFPCYDHPNDFFTTEMFVTVDKPLTVISNGKLLETKENADGSRTFHWRIDEPHASYLTSLVVGEFTPIVSEYAGIPIMTNVYPNEVAEGKVTTARLAEMVRFFSEKTGVKYPYAKYAQTTVRDFGGGMENISATTQTDNMIHDARTELDQTSDGLQSHELAHQWFGDYVTCRSWADIWLNESFATYFQAMWDEHHLGHDDFLYLDVKGNQDQYYAAWKRGNRRPIVTENYANPDAVFDTYAYPRGGAVLHMLRTFLGEENWWRSINHYLTKYAHQPVQTEQFRIAIEEATGQSMDWFFDEWVYRMGHPVFEINKSYDAANKKLTLEVAQTQKTDPDSDYPQVKFFQTPVDIEIVTPGGTRVERVTIQAQEKQSFVFDVDAEPTLVGFDYGDTLIKEVKFNKPTNELAWQLKHDQDVTGRIWALGQLNARLSAAETSQDDRAILVRVIGDASKNDQFWAVRAESVTALKNGGELSRDALIAAVKDPKPQVRVAAVNALAAAKDPALAGVFQSGLKDQSYLMIHVSAQALGQTKSPDAYAALVALIDVPSWRDRIRASALNGLAALGDKRALDLGLRYAAKGNPTPVRAAALRLVGSTGKADNRVFDVLSNALMESFDKTDFNLFSASADGLVALGDSRGMGLVDDQLKKLSADSPLRGPLTQFQDRLRRASSGAENNTARP